MNHVSPISVRQLFHAVTDNAVKAIMSSVLQSNEVRLGPLIDVA